jgi:hypothetical protein
VETELMQATLYRARTVSARLRVYTSASY